MLKFSTSYLFKVSQMLDIYFFALFTENPSCEALDECDEETLWESHYFSQENAFEDN